MSDVCAVDHEFILKEVTDVGMRAAEIVMALRKDGIPITQLTCDALMLIVERSVVAIEHEHVDE